MGCKKNTNLMYLKYRNSFITNACSSPIFRWLMLVVVLCALTGNCLVTSLLGCHHIVKSLHRDLFLPATSAFPVLNDNAHQTGVYRGAIPAPYVSLSASFFSFSSWMFLIFFSFLSRWGRWGWRLRWWCVDVWCGTYLPLLLRPRA